MAYRCSLTGRWVKGELAPTRRNTVQVEPDAQKQSVAEANAKREDIAKEQSARRRKRVHKNPKAAKRVRRQRVIEEVKHIAGRPLTLRQRMGHDDLPLNMKYSEVITDE